MPLTPEQFDRCACECMARMVNTHDEPLDLKAKAAVAVQAAKALSDAITTAKQQVGPMPNQKKIGGRK